MVYQLNSICIAELVEPAKTGYHGTHGDFALAAGAARAHIHAVHGESACSEDKRKSRKRYNIAVDPRSVRGGCRNLYDLVGGPSPHSGDFPEWKPLPFILLKCSQKRTFQGTGPHSSVWEWPIHRVMGILYDRTSPPWPLQANQRHI